MFKPMLRSQWHGLPDTLLEHALTERLDLMSLTGDGGLPGAASIFRLRNQQQAAHLLHIGGVEGVRTPDAKYMMTQFEYFLRIVCPALHLNLDEQAAMLGVPVDSLLATRDGTSAEELAGSAELVEGLTAIHAALCLVYSNDSDAKGWLRRPNSARAFGGLAPLQVLMHHNSELTIRVAGYLQSTASCDFS